LTCTATTGANTRGRPLRGQVRQASQSAGREPAPPLSDGVERAAQAGRDHRIRVLRGGGQHDPGPQHVALLSPTPGDSSLQHLPLAAGQPDRQRSIRAGIQGTTRSGTTARGSDGSGESSHGSVVPAATATSDQERRDTPPILVPMALRPPPGSKMRAMAKVPDSTKSSLEWKLRARAQERWPALASVTVKHRAGFAYVRARHTTT